MYVCFVLKLDQLHLLRVRQRQKPVLVSNFTCKNKNSIFVKEIDTSGYIFAWAIYTLHIDKFAPKHTFFHYSAACLSVIFSYFLV